MKPKRAPVVAQVGRLSDVVLACRDMRHAWAIDSPLLIVEVEGPGLYAERRLGCMRCGKVHRWELYRVYSNRLDRVSTRGSYDEGYLLHGVGRRNVVPLVRRELYDRLVTAIVEAEA
jgi:hypothetical protein